MSNQANNEKQHSEGEASQQSFIALSDEQLEQVSGGDKNLAKLIRVMTDFNSLGVAEFFWQSKVGKQTYKSLKA
jgi:hypothetical protein